MNDTIINDILATLGLQDLSPEEGADIIDRIGVLAIEDVLTKATDALPESAQDEYLKLLDTNPAPDDLFAFFNANIPNFPDLVNASVQEIAQNFKQEV